MSQRFLKVLLEEVPDLSPKVQAVLLKSKDRLTRNDLPVLKEDISPHVTEWTQILKKRYIKDGKPRDWAADLGATREQDLIDVIILDVVGRVAAFGERPISRPGWASAVTRTLTWIAIGVTVWALATRRTPVAVGAGIALFFLVVITRMLAVQDIWTRYHK